MQKPSTPSNASSVPQALRTIFDDIVKACSRSSTKMNLHKDKAKENALAILLRAAVTKYNMNLTSQFQAKHEKTNPGLSYLFAQVCNAVVERTIHEGSCHAQASYALLELAKNYIFDTSLVCSNTTDQTKQHFFLVLPDTITLPALATIDRVWFRVGPRGFDDNSTFFDSWSNQLCLWKDFKPDNSYTQEIRKADQMMFRPFKYIFGNELLVIERILWCLAEYKTRLQSLSPNDNPPPKLVYNSNDPDEEFRHEVDFLSDHQQCINKLLATIELYQAEFNTLLNSKHTKLLAETSQFFKKPIMSRWTAFQKDYLLKTNYKDHEVYYLTLKGEDSKHAPTFFKQLTAQGFSAELKKAADNPSILVDISAP